MADLIDRQAAKKKLLGEAVAKYPCSFYVGLLAAAAELDELPAVDAVEVVRCRDCEHWDGFCYCNCHAADGNGSPIFMRYYDFCSYGKRREENE